MSDLARPLMSFSAKIREALEKANAELIECKDELRTRDNKLVSLESQLARLYIIEINIYYIIKINN